jgi:hypothetical protein
MQSETRQCQNCKKDFVIEPDDFTFYEKMKVPAPVNCPSCRFRWRAAFRNEMTLYNRKCQLCDKPVITMYNPKSPYTVYCNECWASDKWDAFSFAMDYDSNRLFFDQLRDLTERVPRAATYASSSMGQNINSEYTNFAGANKDCYLLFNCGPRNENCSYSRGLMQSRDTFDCYYGLGDERSYEGVNVQKCNGVIFGQNTFECLDCWFLLGCSGCTNCFGCVNLRNKSHYWFNEPLPKEEWLKRANEVCGSYKKMQEALEQFKEFSLKFPRRQNNNLKSVNSSGEYVFESKNAQKCFEATNCEDVKYIFSQKYNKDSYDQIGHGRYSELLLEGVGVGANSSRIIAGWCVENSREVEYSFATRSSAYCFGCDGVKNAEYCILNKKYSESEYKKLREKIISELKNKNLYGLFIPPKLAFFGYNETVGQDNLPLSKEQALVMDFKWQDELQLTRGKETLKPQEISDNIKDADNSILKEIFACETCGRNYKLTQNEFDFYKKMVLPIPRKCFFCRHGDRVKRRGPMETYDRNCDKCKKPIKTSYSPDGPEIVYCEQCYNAEVS